MSTRFILLFALLGATAVSAETVYVGDTLHVGVRAEPGGGGAALAVVTTGDAVEVLQRRKGYLQVKLADGRTGWVDGQYFSTELPARERLQQALQARQLVDDELELLRGRESAAQQQVTRLRARVAGMVADNARQQSRVEVLEKNNTALQMQLETKPRELRVEVPAPPPLGGWRNLVLLGSLLGLVGFLLGAGWQRGRLRRRFGGFHY